MNKVTITIEGDTYTIEEIKEALYLSRRIKKTPTLLVGGEVKYESL